MISRIDNSIYRIARSIAKSSYFDDCDISDILDRLKNLGIWEQILIEVKSEIDLEIIEKLAEQRAREEKILYCYKCNRPYMNKELIDFHPYGNPYRYSGLFCKDCLPKIEDEYKNNYCRACMICGKEFIKYTGSLCDSCNTYGNRKEVQRVNANNFRTKNLGLISDLTILEWLEIIDRFDRVCAYCKENTFSEMDHIISVSRGGGTTKDNVLPVCKNCNIRKGDKSIDDFIGIEQMQLRLLP